MIELEPGRGFEDALADLDGWQYVWVVAWFDRNTTWRPKVTPPRSRTKRGVFSTRSPHRPNPIALSVFELVSVEGLSVRVRNVDLLDGTPILDLKPYVPWTDAITEARTGWLEREGQGGDDPGPRYDVVIEPNVEALLARLGEEGEALGIAMRRSLALGPSPHAYRRIKPLGDGFVLAIKAWRIHFRVQGAEVVCTALRSGYRAAELSRPEHVLHRLVEASALEEP